jgi:WD repeat-containing protein 26
MKSHESQLIRKKTARSLYTIKGHEQPVSTAAWTPGGDAFVIGSLDSRSSLKLHDASNGEVLYSWPASHRVQDLAISPDGRRLVTISPAEQIFVYNFVTREEEYSVRLKTSLTCVSISRDSKYMLVNVTDNELQLIDINTADIVRRFWGQQQGTYVIRSTFGGGDENLVISGSEGRGISPSQRASPRPH